MYKDDTREQNYSYLTQLRAQYSMFDDAREPISTPISYAPNIAQVKRAQFIYIPIQTWVFTIGSLCTYKYKTNSAD